MSVCVSVLSEKRSSAKKVDSLLRLSTTRI